MNFYTVRDLRTTPKSIWENLSADGEVIITNNGRPTAILFDIVDGSFEETVKAVRQAKAMIAFNSMRAKAAANGYMSDEDIEAEIAAARRGGMIAYAGGDRHKHSGVGALVEKRSARQSCQYGADRRYCSLL